MASLLYKSSIEINDKISIHIPTVKEIIDDEDNYNSLISLITATPYSMMVQLDDIGVDFTTITEYELFCSLFEQLKQDNTSLIFENLELTNFILAQNNDNGNIILYDPINDITIDKAIYEEICKTLCEILHIERINKKPANAEAKKFMIDRARKKQKRALRKLKNKKFNSQLEDLIVSVVNTEQYPYNYESTLGLSIYQFYASFYQIVKKIKFDNMMIGCYAGTVKIDELSPKELSWISEKN